MAAPRVEAYDASALLPFGNCVSVTLIAPVGVE
jgi:hypothetical protein